MRHTHTSRRHGYVVLLLDIEDSQAYDSYLEAAARTVVASGGTFLFASDHPTVVEGIWPAQRTIVIEFPTESAARTWYDSDEYQPLINDRVAAAVSTVALFGGSEPAAP